MMYKVINLGSEFEATGETRVRVLNFNLVKTASTDIQKFWDTLSLSKEYVYLWVIGVSAYEYYGCNNNGDAFTEDWLKKNHNTFVENAHVFLHHVNKDPRKSIGKPIFSFYNDTMHRAELILRIDKNLPSAKSTITRIKKGEIICVSMGCRVKYDVCSICGNKAKTRDEYCDHVKYNMKAILSDGRQVLVFNPDPKFFDISIVNRPADQIAMSLDKIAMDGNTQPVELSAKLGEDAETYSKKLAALDKLSDIIKKVDGPILNIKDGDEDINLLKRIDPKKLDYPVLEFNDLEDMDVAPGCILRALAEHGAPPSIGELTYAYGKQQFGSELTPAIIKQIFDLIPSAIRMLRACGAPLERIGYPVLNESSYEGITDELMRRVAPVARTRVFIIKQAADKGILDKFAASIIDEVENPVPNRVYERPSMNNSVLEGWRPTFRLHTSKGPGFHQQETFTHSDGKVYQVSNRSADIAAEQNSYPRMISKSIGAALGVAALGALMVEPDLVKRLLTATGLGIGAISAWNTEPSKVIISDNGVEIPSNSLFTEKRASATTQFVRENAGALIGMSIPTALGLDYLVNSRVKYPDIQNPQQYMTPGKRRMYNAGEMVEGSPIAAVVGGGILGASAGPMFKSLISGLRKRP